MNFCLNPRNLVSIVFVFLTAGISQAQTTTTAPLTVTSVSGGSLVFPTTSSGTTSTTPKIYGAYSTAANNCTTNVIGDGLLPCNPDVIIDGSSLVVNFTWNKADAVNARRVKFLIAPTSGGTNVQIGNPVTINAVGQYSITAPWDEIRNQVCPSGWASCSADVKTFNINLGVDDTPEDFTVDSGLGVVINATVEVFDGMDPLFSEPCGTSDTGGAICGFSVFPGDKKFFFDDLEPATANLTGSNSINSGYKGLQIYFKEVPQGSTDIAVLESMINTDPSTSIGITSDDDFDIRLTDLENDTRYCVIFAGVTNAGTITKFFPDNRSGAIDDASKYCNTPSEVFGLLDNKKCFVATAAYGSELDPHVQTFRNFRNQILMRSELGRTLTQFYYAHSPEYAKIISQEPILKAGVRGILWVLLLFVQLSLKFGLMLTILGCTFLFLLSYRSVQFAYLRNQKVQNKKWQSKNSRFLSMMLIGLLAASNLISVRSEAQSKAVANNEFLFQKNDDGSAMKASQQKVKKKQETLVDQEVKNEPMPDDSLFDTNINPVEPESLFSEEPRQPEIPVVNEPEVFIPKDHTEELKSAWDKPIEDRVVKDLVKKEEGVHYYKINKQSGSRQSTSFKIGFMPPPDITNTLTDANGNESVVTYKDIYPQPTLIPVGLYEYEWSPLKNWSLLKAQVGVGGFYAQGSGRFANGDEAREQYTFIGIPMFLGAKLRMQLGNAWLVPYVSGGGSYYALIELRDDGLKRNIVGSPAVYGGGGLMFDLTRFDRETSWIFDREYDISHLWLTAEMRVVRSFSQELDFSSNMIMVGVSADY